MNVNLITLAQQVRAAHTTGTSFKMPMLTINQWHQLDALLA